MQHPEGAALRRHVDTRLVSYAAALVNDPEVRPALIESTRVCTAAVIQAASGISALIRACHGVVNSPYVAKNLNAAQRAYFESLFGSIATSMEDAWKKELGQLMELILLTGAEVSDDEQESYFWLAMASTVGMNTRPFAIHEEDNVRESKEKIVDDDAPVAPHRKRKRGRSSKEIYQNERLINLVTQCIALGVVDTKAFIADGHVFVVGTTAEKATKRLAKLRGTLDDAQELCNHVNKELKSFSSSAPKTSDSMMRA